MKALLLTISDCRKIEKRIVYVVNGFIHESQELLPANNVYYNIPELIIQICLIFYHIKEYWDPEWCNINFDIDGNVISPNQQCGTYRTAFLYQCISKGAHHWQFKILVKGPSNGIDIGICKTSQLSMAVKSYFTRIKSNGYAYNCTGMVLYSIEKNKNPSFNIKRCREGDIIDMYVDFNKAEIKFSVNDEDLGVAFKDIAKSEYRAAVSIKNQKDKFELLLYEQMDPDTNGT